ncbi:MAG TPA: hypothetical protein PK563_15950, partial [Tenuifilaceae bacterium]|nr:hypothetical protein [Tenuifilaceae bacterium]
MKKVYKFITQVAATITLLTIVALNTASAAGLSVFILYGENAVTEVEACQGTTVAMTVEVFGGTGSGHVFTWSGDTDPTYFVDLGDLVSYKNTTPDGTYNLTVDVEDDGGFTGTASVTVIIKPSPLASIVANGATTFCDGESVELEETNGQAGVSYQWQKNFANISGASAETYDATESGLFRVRVTNTTSNCSKYSNQISITVNPLPAANAINDGPYCDGQTINLFSEPNGMVDYDWTTDAVTPFTSALQNPTIAGADSDNSGTYTVTVEDGNGCVNSAQTVVLVYEPLDPGEIGTNHSICYNGDPNEITSVTDPSGGGDVWTTYEWQSRAGAGGWTLVVGANDLTYDPPAGLTETTHYRRRGVSTACGNTDWSNQVTVTVYDEVVGGTIGSDDDICYNVIPDPFTNDVSPSGGTDSWTYEWQYQEDGDVVWTPIASTNDSEYTHPTPLTVTTKFRRMATDALCGFAYSNEIT